MRKLMIYTRRGRLLKKCLSTSTERRGNVKKFSEMPGETSFKAFWTIRNAFLKGPSYEAKHIMDDLHEKHGKIIRMWLPGRKWVVSTRSIEDAELMFRSEGESPSRGTHEDNIMWIYENLNLPPPMFFSKGVIWKKTRSFAAKQIIPRRVGNFVNPLCEVADEFLEHLESLMDDSGTVADVVPEINKWAFQGVSYFVYGEKINIYTSMNPIQKEFVEAGLDYIRSLVKTINASPIYKIFPTKAYKDYVKMVHRIHAAGKTLLKEHSERLKDNIASGEVDDTKAVGLLDQWLIERKFTEEEALSQSYDMLAAGIDTTANMSSFLLFELARHPDIQEQVVKEMTSVLGSTSNPSWEDLQKMNVIRNCIKETMRIYTPTGGIPRVLAKDGIFSGYEVPAGTTVVVGYRSVAIDGEYITDPHKFIPHRWNKSAEEKLHPFLSLPFGFGPRSCYGRRLAELEMLLLVTQLLSRYSLSTNIEKLKMTWNEVVLRPYDPLPIKFTRRL